MQDVHRFEVPTRGHVVELTRGGVPDVCSFFMKRRWPMIQFDADASSAITTPRLARLHLVEVSPEEVDLKTHNNPGAG